VLGDSLFPSFPPVSSPNSAGPGCRVRPFFIFHSAFCIPGAVRCRPRGGPARLPCGSYKYLELLHFCTESCILGSAFLRSPSSVAELRRVDSTARADLVPCPATGNRAGFSCRRRPAAAHACRSLWWRRHYAPATPELSEYPRPAEGRGSQSFCLNVCELARLAMPTRATAALIALLIVASSK